MRFLNLAKALAVSAFAFTATSASAALVDLGFSIDESGSIGAANFNNARDSLATALGVIPTTGDVTYRVAVTTFSNGSTVVIPPTEVTSAAVLANIQSTLTATTFSGGGTNTSGAITTLTNLFTSAPGGLGDTTLFNITTDGFPNSQANSIAAADAAIAAGVDGLSFEVVPSFSTPPSQALLQTVAELARPNEPGVVVTDINNIPDATKQGFVIEVTDFADYEAAIKAKITTVVDDTGGGDPNVVPLPAGGVLMLTGLLGLLGFRRFSRAA